MLSVSGRSNYSSYTGQLAKHCNIRYLKDPAGVGQRAPAEPLRSPNVPSTLPAMSPLQLPRQSPGSQLVLKDPRSGQAARTKGAAGNQSASLLLREVQPGRSKLNIQALR